MTAPAQRPGVSRGEPAPGEPAGLRVRRLGRVGYADAWEAMRRLTDERTAETADEVWLLEHPPVYTLGQAGRPEHVRDAGEIPVTQTDRGGQVTYHGPGQLVAYLLVDLGRRRLGVRRFVELLEQAVVDTLAGAGVAGSRRAGAPGVYVDGRKVASLGLRVRRGCSYHGLALNVDLDLAPFRAIDPCGYPGLAVTSLRELGLAWTVEEAGERLLGALIRRMPWPGS